MRSAWCVVRWGGAMHAASQFKRRGRLDDEQRGEKCVLGGQVMRLVPKQIAKKIQFYENHVEPFTQHAEAIGATPEVVAEFTSLVESTRQAYNEQQAAILAARTATQRLNQLAKRMQLFGQAIIDTARNTADRDFNPSVLILAQIPSRKRKSTIDPPGTPSNLRTSIDGAGNLTLIWDCRNPQGSRSTMYKIYRASKGEPKRMLASVGKRKFVDDSIPAGTTELMYYIEPYRSTGTGETGIFVVKFGSNRTSPTYRTRQQMFAAA